MGSSTRKIQKKIKDILKNSGGEINETLPEVISETIRMRRATKYFGNEDFENLVIGGLVGIASIGSGNFNRDYETEVDINLVENEPDKELKVEQIIEVILDKVEENDEVENSLVLAAFKVTMSELILNNKLNNEEFLTKFMSNLLYSLTMENINEAVLEAYEDIHTKDFTDKVKEFADTTIKNYMSESIKDFIGKKIEIKELIQKVSNLNVKGDEIEKFKK